MQDILNHKLCKPLCFGLLLFCVWGVNSIHAQLPTLRDGEGVSTQARLISERGLKYLLATQLENGSWPGNEASGSGVVGIAVMALMATGEDPDHGPYADAIRKALRYMILNQNTVTGVATGPGHGPMYHHGFACLALSEAYGVVHERLLWEGSDVSPEQRRSIGEALDLAVRCSLTAQKKNPYKAWRYSPESQDADTTVSGTVLMGLLGARNAGMEVPNEAIENALAYFRANTLRDGSVSYQLSNRHGDGITRAAIATLVYAIGKRTDTREYQAASGFIRARMDQDVDGHPFYHRYYMAQALFQSDFESWKAWNQRIIGQLQKMQAKDGSFSSSHGKSYGTGMSILALALNYRLLPVYER
ncbi:squalene--hopene cyclase [Verrucomicrobia bacterium]|nr:squalene--hopene cyclase [Verrucomicrobiota bacterium]